MAAVFANDADQLARAMASREKLGVHVETPVVAGARFYLAEDYHQKYHLRRDRELLREFGDYSPRQLVDSTVAARLNGYVGGRGKLTRDELATFGLSAAATDRLARVVARG